MKKALIALMMVLLAAVLMVSCNNNTPTNSNSYKVGDEGPAGGLIFYVNPNAEADGWTYLEVAKIDISDNNHPADQGPFKFKWGPATAGDFGTGTEIGDGLDNTRKLSENGSDYEAAYAVYGKDLYGNEYTDWFIPSKEEIKLLYNSFIKSELGSFSINSDYYWTSSEWISRGTGKSAWTISFSNGSTDYNSCNEKYRVRPIRRFN